MVGLSGVEPLTSPLSGVRSNQLSYRPMRRKFTGIPNDVKNCRRPGHRHPCYGPRSPDDAGAGAR